MHRAALVLVLVLVLALQPQIPGIRSAELQVPPKLFGLRKWSLPGLHGSSQPDNQGMTGVRQGLFTPSTTRYLRQVIVGFLVDFLLMRVSVEIALFVQGCSQER